jgi:hypothetical protein
MRKNRERGGAAVETALGMLVSMPLLMGTTIMASIWRGPST